MDVILKEDLPKLGTAGTIVKVKDGYARNFLIPKALALEVTPANLKIVEAQRRVNKAKEESYRKKAQEVADRLANISCTITALAGEDDKLFGSVTTADIAEVLKQEGIVMDKKNILLEEEIHRLGIFYFQVKLHPEVSQRVKLWVVKR
jgi:large subunit ribosomal protein L9